MYLPDDVCLFVQNAPTRWTVVPQDNEQIDSLPALDHDLLDKARLAVH